MKRILFALSLLMLVITAGAQQFNLNDRIEAEDKGQWYKATIIRGKGGQHYKDGKYFIHWDGYAATYDVWIEESKIRKPEVKTATANSANTVANPPATAKYKVGDKVVYHAQGFPEGTVTGYKNGYYIVDVADPTYTAQGKQGMDEKWLMPVWPYKTFFEELSALEKKEIKSEKGYDYQTSKIKDLARMVCDECSSGSYYADGQSQGYIDRAKLDLESLQALVKKYEPLPDDGNKWYYMNPKIVGDVAAKGNDVISRLQSSEFKRKVQMWFTADMYFYDLTHPDLSTDHVLFNGKSFGDFAVCGSLSELKTALTANLNEAIKKYGLSMTAEEYLKGFDENFEKRKAKLISEAEQNAWVKTDYPYLDNTLNALVANANLKTLNVYYNVNSFQVYKDDAGYITEQAKGGVVIYQKQGCSYWMWQYITAYKPYLGNGKYGPAKMRFMDYGFIKPF